LMIRNKSMDGTFKSVLVVVVQRESIHAKCIFHHPIRKSHIRVRSDSVFRYKTLLRFLFFN